VLLEEITDSIPSREKFFGLLEKNVQKKDEFLAVMNFQEIVRQKYQLYYLYMYADYELNQHSVSDNAYKMTKEFKKDMEFYNQLGQETT
jgi:hypothetical protein